MNEPTIGSGEQSSLLREWPSEKTIGCILQPGQPCYGCDRVFRLPLPRRVEKTKGGLLVAMPAETREKWQSFICAGVFWLCPACDEKHEGCAKCGEVHAQKT